MPLGTVVAPLLFVLKTTSLSSSSEAESSEAVSDVKEFSEWEREGDRYRSRRAEGEKY